MDRTSIPRRIFLAQAGVAAGGVALLDASVLAAEGGSADEGLLIVGVACSPRKGMTTAAGVRIALDAAGEADPRIRTELIDLGGMNISAWSGGATPSQAAAIEDDFALAVEPVMRDSNLAGLIIGSPVYFRALSALCKAFLERLAVLRKPSFLLADVPVGALAVGAYRNGGQELVIEQILTAMLCHEVMVVGGKPRAHQGATLWNHTNDDIRQDEFGVETARNLGVRVAEAALRIRRR